MGLNGDRLRVVATGVETHPLGQAHLIGDGNRGQVFNA
jgi:hypothetical protein